MVCPKCGAMQASEVKFCTTCGTPIPASSGAQGTQIQLKVQGINRSFVVDGNPVLQDFGTVAPDYLQQLIEHVLPQRPHATNACPATIHATGPGGAFVFAARNGQLINQGTEQVVEPAHALGLVMGRSPVPAAVPPQAASTVPAPQTATQVSQPRRSTAKWVLLGCLGLPALLVVVVVIGVVIYFQVQESGKIPADQKYMDPAERLLAKGELPGAISTYEKMIDDEPNDLRALNNLGAIKLMDGNLPEARKYFEQALELAPSYTPALNNLGLCALKEGKPDDAYDCFQLAISFNGCPDAYTNLGDMLSASGRYDEAEKHFLAAIVEDPEHYGARRNLGALYLSRDEGAKALGHFRVALKAHPDSFSLLKETGFAAVAAGELDQAIGYFVRAIEMEPKDPRVHHGMGLALCYKGHLQRAVKALRYSLHLKPDDDEVHTDLGIAFQEYRIPDAEQYAMVEFRRAIKLNSKNEIATYNLAVLTALHGTHEKAIPLYRKVLELNPENLKALTNLGVLLNKMKRHREALKLLEEAQRLAPRLSIIQVNRAVSLFHLGQKEASHELLRKVIAAEKNDEVRSLAQAMLKGYR